MAPLTMSGAFAGVYTASAVSWLGFDCSRLRISEQPLARMTTPSVQAADQRRALNCARNGSLIQFFMSEPDVEDGRHTAQLRYDGLIGRIAEIRIEGTILGPGGQLTCGQCDGGITDAAQPALWQLVGSREFAQLH